ncbi:MAG: heavy-metal-associated domain-containing protein [Chitinophagaceae bacterium]|nr:heavy-metal-associated domain-containing protein [Chitinophagaceae bacterium]
MKEITFKTNINCSGCVARVTPLLNEIKTIKSWNVNVQDPAKILTVQAEDDAEPAVTHAVKKAGFTIEKI